MNGPLNSNEFLIMVKHVINESSLIYHRDDIMEKEKTGTGITENNFFQTLKDVFVGDKSKVMYIKNDDEIVMSFPWLFIVLFLVVFDVPSLLVGILLFLLVIFNLDFHIETKKKKDIVEKSTIDVDEYNKKAKNVKQPEVTEENGYYKFKL